MKKENIILIILFIAAIIFQIWIFDQVAAHKQAERKRIEDNWKEFPSDRELDSMQFYPVIDEKAYIIDGDTLATENI